MEVVFEIVSRAGRTLERHKATGPRLSIGRAFDNELILSDETVSPHHAVLERDPDGNSVLVDLDSLNGIRNERHELWFRIVGERRESESCVTIFPPKCEPFAFLSGTDDPEQKVSVLRFVQDWSWRTSSDVVAARSTASVGLGVLGATTSGDSNRPDSRFFAWLGQVQWAHRFSERFWSSELVFRTDLQLAADPLLSLEKIAVGGLRTVRGYRENQIVRDNGFVSSVELRIPVYRSPLGRPVVQLIPFVDRSPGRAAWRPGPPGEPGWWRRGRGRRATGA